MTDAVGPRFHQDHGQISLPLQCCGHETVAAANIEERTAGGEPPEHGQQTGIAMSEPKRIILKRKAVTIPLRRVGNRFSATSAPNSIRAALQTIREKREVDLCSVIRWAAGGSLGFSH